jgi:hypothetical protein
MIMWLMCGGRGEERLDRTKHKKIKKDMMTIERGEEHHRSGRKESQESREHMGYV